MDDALNTWLSWNCPDCNYRSYQRLQTKCTIPAVESNYVLGMQVICLHCKLVSEHPEYIDIEINGGLVKCKVLEDATEKLRSNTSNYAYLKVSYQDAEYFAFRVNKGWREISGEDITNFEQMQKAFMKNEVNRANR